MDGKGMLPELYASVLNSFQPNNLNMETESGSCLPNPLPPDFARYKQIGEKTAHNYTILIPSCLSPKS